MPVLWLWVGMLWSSTFSLPLFLANMDLVLRILDLHGVSPQTLGKFFYQWHPPLKGKFFKKVWAASFYIILWLIWKEQNARIFENKICSFPHIHELILLRLSWWIEEWGDPFPYNANEVIRNPGCLRWSCSTVSKQILGNPQPSPAWSPPINSLKWMWMLL